MAKVQFAKLPSYLLESSIPHFVSLSGGEQRISLDVCEECSAETGYSLRRVGGDPERIGGDPEVLSAAINALLTQPGVDIFTVVVDRRGRERIVIPRHHLPSFLVGRRG